MIIYIADKLLEISEDEASSIASGLDLYIGYYASEISNEEIEKLRILFNQFKNLGEK